MLTLELRQMGTYGVQLKGVFPWLVCWARRASTRNFYPALSALASPVKKTFLTVHYFNLRVPIAQQPGQVVVQGRLSLSVYLLC